MYKQILHAYLDNASTTRISKEVSKTMFPYFDTNFGNPSSIHSGGIVASKAIEDSRKNIAKMINAQPDTIFFTGGGTEANNLAIFGAAEALSARGQHIISFATEHASVLEPLSKLEKQGYKISFVSVDKNGLFNINDVARLITPETILISIIYANNEVGTISPIADLGRAILRYRKENNTEFPYFHSDACQASQYLTLDVEKLHVDLMTINSGKIYGPKGVGALYVRRGIIIEPQILGGGQEKGARSGTENVAGVVGFAKALELISKNKEKESKRLHKLSDYFLKGIFKIFPDAKLNGPEIGEDRLPNNLNILFQGFDGEQLVLYLDSFGIQCSTASACSAVTNEPSHVLKAIGLTETENKSSVRFSFGKDTTKNELAYTLKTLVKIKFLLKK